MKAKGLFLSLILALLLTLLSGCVQEKNALQNGYYTATVETYGMGGWKDYLTIYVEDNRIITVEYDGVNENGFVKSWDMEYMKVMKAASGTYPSEFIRGYAEELVRRQDPARVDAITGATESLETFRQLAEAALNQSRSGDTSIAYIQDPTIMQGEE